MLANIDVGSSGVFFARELKGFGSSLGPVAIVCKLLYFALLTFCLPGLAESREQVRQRLDQYRQLDAEAARKKEQHEAEAERRGERAQQLQEQRRREEYARRWKRYEDIEIDVLKWRQQNDGTWVTEFKLLPPSARGSSVSLGSGVLSRAVDRVWVKVRSDVTIEELASALAQDESRLATLNDVDEDHQFQRGDWLVLPSQAIREAKHLAAIDTSELRRIPPLEALPVAQEPRRFDESLARLIKLGVLSQSDARRILGRAISPDALIGVNCVSLMVNQKPAYQNWGSWARPARGSFDEQLVIDRCTTLKP